MKRFLIFVFTAVSCLISSAQDTFKGVLNCQEENLTLVIDLYKESIEVPGMEMFGPMHGYLKGNIYGIWSITSAKLIDNTHALIRLSNDQGSETQEVKLTKRNENEFDFEQIDGVCIKKVVGRKLVKIPKRLIFRILK